MTTTNEASDPTIRPDIVVADATSLAYLVWAGQLPLLHAIGGAVLLVDVVAGETASDLSRTDAMALTQWIAAGAGKSSHPVRVDETEIGQALALARLSEPGFRAPRASEVAITEWLVTAIREAVRPVIVLTENSRVPGIVTKQAADADVSVVTTRGLLALVEGRELLASAEATWKTMLDRADTALSSDRHARLSQGQLDECVRLIEAEVADRTTNQQDRGAIQNDGEVSASWHNMCLAIENARLAGLEIDADAKVLLELQASGLISADETVAQLKKLYRLDDVDKADP